MNRVNRRLSLQSDGCFTARPCLPLGGSVWLLGLKLQYHLVSLSPQGLIDHPVLGEHVSVCMRSFFSATKAEYKFHKSPLWAFGCSSHMHVYQQASSHLSWLDWCVMTQSHLQHLVVRLWNHNSSKEVFWVRVIASIENYQELLGDLSSVPNCSKGLPCDQGRFQCSLVNILLA